MNLKIFDKWNAKYLIIVLKDDEERNPYKAFIPAFRRLVSAQSDFEIELKVRDTIIECLQSANMCDQPTYSGEELSEDEIKDIVISEFQNRTTSNKEEIENMYVYNLWFEVKTKLTRGE